MTSDAMWDTLKLCVSCKACKLECPTGVDMSRMKIEVAAARFGALGPTLQDRLVANLPAAAPWLSRFSAVANLPGRLPGLARLMEPVTGFSARRKLPTWSRESYQHIDAGPVDGRPVILFADTFNTWFEPENLVAAREVLAAAGYRVISPPPASGNRPACCGRTWLTTGDVERAKQEIRRTADTWRSAVDQGAVIIGLEPSCTLGLREDLPALGGRGADHIASQIFLFEEFLADEDPDLDLRAPAAKALLHGHCHQKAHRQMSQVETVLGRIPGLEVNPVESACCGMAGAFGYGRDTWEISQKMAEAGLLPAVRKASPDTLIVADGTSCRHQIELGSGRNALHVARVLAMALAGSGPLA
jgi:Fe-S oxidoreductase